jgi:hypothetical protein
MAATISGRASGPRVTFLGTYNLHAGGNDAVQDVGPVDAEGQKILGNMDGARQLVRPILGDQADAAEDAAGGMMGGTRLSGIGTGSP